MRELMLRFRTCAMLILKPKKIIASCRIFFLIKSLPEDKDGESEKMFPRIIPENKHNRLRGITGTLTSVNKNSWISRRMRYTTVTNIIPGAK
jgi:hypothetical protein